MIHLNDNSNSSSDQAMSYTQQISEDNIRSNNGICEEHSTLLNRNMDQRILRDKPANEQRNFIVGMLTMFFAMGSWIGVTSTFLQLPLLVDKAPEKWSLPSYLVIIGQMANIGPFTYTILQKSFPNWVNNSYVIYFVKAIGVISSLLAAFFHNQTALIDGQMYSVSLFIIFFFLAIVGCTSSVLFMPYVGRFTEFYLITYLIGEGLGGFIPSVVTLIQGVGGNSECILVNTTDGPKYDPYHPPPRFGTRDFYLFVFSLYLSSYAAFTLLDKLAICKKHYVAVSIVHGNKYAYSNEHEDKYANKEGVKQLTPRNYKFMLLLMGTICFFSNGVFPSIQSFSCLPYGNMAYHLTVSLTAMASPCVCILALFLPHTTMRSILVTLTCSTIVATYTATTALLSPNPPLVDNVWGEVIVVICWTIFMGLTGYLKLCVTSVMRFQGGKSLVWTGAVSQAGSAIGSILIFILINYTSIFKSNEPC